MSHEELSNAPRAGASLGRRGLAASVLLCLTLVAGWAVGKSPLADANPDPDGGVLHSIGDGPVHLEGRLDRGSVLQGSDGRFGMNLVLSADDVEAVRRARVATDLVVVLDRSGSMSGRPLDDAKGAIRELIARLGNGDRFALVAYDSSAQLVVPLQPATSGHREQWSQLVAHIGTGGGTNMSSGLDLASATVAGERQPGRLPRIILLSDGHANEGDHSYEGLRARAGRAVAGEYVLSAVGVGDGFDEVLMTSLADAGTGNFYYVRDGRDLGDVFAGEFESARETVASAVTVEIELAPGIELVDAAGYPIERAGRVARFRPGTLFAGQQRELWLQLQAPTGDPGEREVGEFRLTWRDPRAADATTRVVRLAGTPTIACVHDEAVYAASLDEDLVVRGIAEDKFSLLEQEVAASVREGNLEDAKDRIRAFKRENAAPLMALGYAPEEMPSYQEADRLAEQVDEAFRAPAAAPARNALSKRLSASGQDGRRQGAKKDTVSP
jgi:Ca-activated chloride channel family protein